MTYKLLIGNNFILGNPKKVNFKDSQIFSMNEDKQGPYINTELFDINGAKIIEIIKNNVIFCNRELGSVNSYVNTSIVTSCKIFMIALPCFLL